MEIWKAFYETSRNEWCVSNHGRVKIISKRTGKTKYPHLAESGGHAPNRYKAISINCAPEKYVHRIVAGMFLENPDNLPVVNHIDGNKSNNHVDNLEWIDHEGNMQHAWKTGLKTNKWGQGTKEIRERRAMHWQFKHEYPNLTYREIGEQTGYDHQLVRLDVIRYEEYLSKLF